MFCPLLICPYSLESVKNLVLYRYRGEGLFRAVRGSLWTLYVYSIKLIGEISARRPPSGVHPRADLPHKSFILSPLCVSNSHRGKLNVAARGVRPYNDPDLVPSFRE